LCIVVRGSGEGAITGSGEGFVFKEAGFAACFGAGSEVVEAGCLKLAVDAAFLAEVVAVLLVGESGVFGGLFAVRLDVGGCGNGGAWASAG
jgi:hypothetical protein